MGTHIDRAMVVLANEDLAMHLTDQQAAVRAAQREGLVEELVEALKKAEALLGFHEQSALSRPDGAYPTVHVCGKAWRDLANVVRDAIAKAGDIAQ